MYCVKDDMVKKGVPMEMTADRGKWKKSTYCSESTKRVTGRSEINSDFDGPKVSTMGATLGGPGFDSR